MNRIQYLRKKKGWTQEELAKKLNISVSSIASYENNRRSPSRKIAKLMSKLFNCSIDYLLGDSNNELPPNEILLYNQDIINLAKDINKLDIEQQNTIKLLIKQMK